MQPNPFFWIALASLLVHEMDAIHKHEWRMFPLTMMLSERLGYMVFTAVHIPLYVILFQGLYSNDVINHPLSTGISVFCILHVGLHLIYLRHPLNEFVGIFSWCIILLAGVAGCVSLI